MSLGGCPIPKTDYERISIAHGGGGRLSLNLFERIFKPAFGNPILVEAADAAVLNIPRSSVAMSTDSYVVRPLFFPGGDIGKLAVHGTVNDLAVSGARPVALSAAFVLEEGLCVETLWKVVTSMHDALSEVEGLAIVCGDTKVIERPPGQQEPGLIITTTGLGVIETERRPSAGAIREGDVIVVSGPLGDHGMAVMSVREGLEFDSPIESDTQSLWGLVLAMLSVGGVSCMRDLTRGGLSSALNELALTMARHSATVRFVIYEADVPVRESVASACEILGFDPLYVACEGRLVAFVRPESVDAILKTMREHHAGRGAVRIGEVKSSDRPEVIVQTIYGAQRPLDMLSGEQLPRIC